MVHVGVDLHKRLSQIAVLTEGGELTQHRLANEPLRLERFFAQLPPGPPVALEASGTWGWLVDLLEDLGHRPVLSHPKQTKAIAAARLKNDRVDAERLLLLLRGDLLSRVWIPPRDLREARELLRHRVSLVWVRTGIKNRLLALLARRNVQPTRSKGWWTERGQRELRAVSLTPIPSTIRADCLALLRLLDEQIRGLDQELVARWGPDAECSG
jgi:transposase